MATATNTAKKSLYEKLLSIMGSIESVELDGLNEAQHYKYTSEKVIKHEIHPLLVKERVLFIMSITDIETIETKIMKERGEAVTRYTTIKTHYMFIDVDSGESLEGDFCGTGVDSGDKALYKAITGAVKYIMTTVFLIPTGDDPEETPKKPIASVAPRPIVTHPVQETFNSPVCAVCQENLIVTTTKDGRQFWSCPNWKDGRKHTTQAIES